MYLQSIKYDKHNAAKSVNRSILKKSRHIGFGVVVVHSSMVYIFLVQGIPGQNRGEGGEYPDKNGARQGLHTLRAHHREHPYKEVRAQKFFK